MKVGYIIGGSGKGGIYDYTHAEWKVQIIADGTTTFNGALSGNASTATRVITPDAGVSYVDGAKGNSAAVFAKKEYNANHWYPAVCL